MIAERDRLSILLDGSVNTGDWAVLFDDTFSIATAAWATAITRPGSAATRPARSSASSPTCCSDSVRPEAVSIKPGAPPRPGTTPRSSARPTVDEGHNIRPGSSRAISRAESEDHQRRLHGDGGTVP